MALGEGLGFPNGKADPDSHHFYNIVNVIEFSAVLHYQFLQHKRRYNFYKKWEWRGENSFSIIQGKTNLRSELKMKETIISPFWILWFNGLFKVIHSTFRLSFIVKTLSLDSILILTPLFLIRLQFFVLWPKLFHTC